MYALRFLLPLLAAGALLTGGAAVCAGAAAPGPDIPDCAQALPAPKASKAAIAAAVANFGTTRVMTKPRSKVRNWFINPRLVTQFRPSPSRREPSPRQQVHAVQG